VLLDLRLLSIPARIACAASLQVDDVLGPHPLALKLALRLYALVVCLLTHDIT
jgi:hypothetical protein